ncbi:hypothetical protein HGM15179_014583, partial [Zosterops borbonicus]
RKKIGATDMSCEKGTYKLMIILLTFQKHLSNIYEEPTRKQESKKNCTEQKPKME